MKRNKLIPTTILVATILVGKGFGGDLSTRSGLSDFFDSIYTAVMSFAMDGGCEGRQCQVCKPGSDDDGGNCRPTR